MDIQMPDSGAAVILEPSNGGRMTVKRDMEVVREILLRIEAKDDLRPELLEFEERDPVVMARHVEFLHEAGLIDGKPVRSGRDDLPRVFVRDLTWAGHDFIAATRNDTVWTSLKASYGKELAMLPLEIIKTAGLKLLTDLMLGKLPAS